MSRFVFSAMLAFVAARALAVTPLELNRKADELFAGFAAPGAPGAALIVLEDGKPVLEKAWGHASIELGVPFTHDTVVRLPYSEAREFLASAAVLMERDGLVKLDAPVRERFPELPAWAAKVTAWDLLNHRSGFVDEWATLLLMHDSMANRFTEEQFLQLLARQPRPEVPPGEGYLYSNSDFGLLKLLLRRAAARPLRDWMRERLFAPLGMTATRLDDDASALVPHRASRYRHSEHGYSLAEPDKSSPGGNYFIASSAADLAKWARALADPQSDAAWANARLRARVRTIPPKQEKHYLFAQTELEIAGEPVVLHQGVLGVTWLARAPARQLAIVATTNRWSVAAEVRALLETALGVAAGANPHPVFPTTPVPMTAETLHRYAGDYEWTPKERWQSERPVRGRRARVTVEGDGLHFFADGISDLAEPVGEGLFVARYGEVGILFRFEPLPDGSMALTIEYDAGHPAEHLRRDATPRWQPTPEDLEHFAGRYRSDFLDYVWTVSPGESPGTLRLRRPTAADAVLAPDGADTFRLRLQDGYGGFDAWVTFHRGADGMPTHLTVGYPRLVDHRFDRVPARE